MYKKILLAYNGSAAGQKALLDSGELAAWGHASLHLVAVMPLNLNSVVAGGLCTLCRRRTCSGRCRRLFGQQHRRSLNQRCFEIALDVLAQGVAAAIGWGLLDGILSLRAHFEGGKDGGCSSQSTGGACAGKQAAARDLRSVIFHGQSPINPTWGNLHKRWGDCHHLGKK